ncbi:hypothetical protein D3C80_2132410 [compost metagenome]
MTDRRREALLQTPGLIQAQAYRTQFATNEMTVHPPAQGHAGMQQRRLRILGDDLFALQFMQAA